MPPVLGAGGPESEERVLVLSAEGHDDRLTADWVLDGRLQDLVERVRRD
ncbi:hypothetical protein NX801_09675 [Streptomyces sp. LP05-1]|uniref:Uncharacterized protein n=1 Tax=Streptomyces pyxinae TaxID=2970734 RepID=A0ABT2CEY2_9ACTN|nr:hypothetical protein [Streptomyces sp. LP05-1]MCS0635931.1 hypothetical protein [Streptomyces sp. LP05-1]